MNRILCIVLFLTSVSYAADVSVTMTADRTQVPLEEQIELQVSVRGIRQGGNPEILNAQDFYVQNSGTSSQVQIVNGQVSQSLVFVFVLSPKQAGQFRIGPARVTVAGKNYESDTIEITVAKAVPATAGTDRFFYIVAEVDNKTPFVNQQVNYTFKFFNRAQLANAQLGLPEFKGFLKEGPDKEKEYEKVINGVAWRVTEFRFAIFPVSSGSLTINPAQLVADAIVRGQGRDSLFDEFFGGSRTKRINVRSEPISLTVTPLPTDDKPANFSGLVGHFNLKTHLGQQNLEAGDSTTLTVIIEGDGNLRDFALPQLTSSELKIYEDQPTFNIKPETSLWKGTKTFKRALVPLKGGELALPVTQLSYFDPIAKAYKTVESKKLTLSVSGTAGEDSLTHVSPEAQGVGKKKIEVLGKDLMPIKRAPTALRNDRLEPREQTLIPFGILACPAAFIFLLILKRRRDRFSSDTGLLRRKSAFKNFDSHLKKINTDGAFFEQSSTLLREYLGNKFNLDGKAITPIDAERKLKAHRLSSDSIRKIEAFLRECEVGQYGGKVASEAEKSKHQNVLISIVRNVEKEVRG